MRSPIEQYELRALEGNAESITEHGRVLGVLADTMESTAERLVELGDSSMYWSQATDKLSTTAAEVEEDLRAAAVRYRLTGEVVEAYGKELDTAQDWINPNIENIRAAEEEYQSALQAVEEAKDDRDGLARVWLWETEPTAEQTADAEDAVTTAEGTLSGAKETRDALWSTFETKFGDWSAAYDTAVDGIEDAMDSADNNDGFWEAFDNFLDVLGWVVLALGVIALVIGAPLTGLLALVIVGISAAILIGELIQFAAGEATLSDVLWAGLGLLPFGAGKLLSRGAPALRPLINGARGSAVVGVRSGLPAMRLQSMLKVTSNGWFRLPSMQLRGPIANASTPWRWLRAPANVRAGLPAPGMLVSPRNALLHGGPEAAQVQTFVHTMRNSPYSGHLVDLLRNPAITSPASQWQRIGFASVYGSSGAIGLTGLLGVDLPVVENITIDNGPVR
ncbi:AAA family ATPase [Agrococcus baldri]|nr:hypothetical protein [Agrococcus baldri]